jgi:ParB-like chromosome segregation protein Spo0J
MTALNALGKQFTVMRPSELLPYAKDRSEPSEQRNIDRIANSIREHGYDEDRHDNPHRAIDTHINLFLHDGGAELVNGNHRVHAMNQIGYDQPVKVRLAGKYLR